MRLIALFLFAGLLAPASTAASIEATLRSVLNAQVAAWNRGDLEGFVQTYSDETIFVGKEVARGSKGVLERYKRSYPTQVKMGTLSFTDLEVKLLGGEYASVLGRFHLARTAAGGGDANGIFTLLLRNTKGGWKIILDHTS
jgi:uncharacterized protein (TIGR02246 family)